MMDRWEKKTCQVHVIMRDMCLGKQEKVSFLHYIGAPSDVVGGFSNEIKNLRRRVVYDENFDFLNRHFENGEMAIICLGSLLVFHEKEALQKVWNAFPLHRVLDVEGTHIDSLW